MTLWCYINYELKWAEKGEVAFFLYDAAIVFHSSVMKNMSKEVKNEMNESVWRILTHNWYNTSVSKDQK